MKLDDEGLRDIAKEAVESLCTRREDLVYAALRSVRDAALAQGREEAFGKATELAVAELDTWHSDAELPRHALMNLLDDISRARSKTKEGERGEG